MTDATGPWLTPRTLRWALVASLALNVLVIGAVAGTLCFSRWGGHDRHGFKGSPLLGFARTLPRERADLIRQKLADAQPSMETARKGVRDARGALRTLLPADTFDQPAFNAALDSLVQAETDMARSKKALFGDVVGQLSPQERKALHDWLEKRRPIR